MSAAFDQPPQPNRAGRASTDVRGMAHTAAADPGFALAPGAPSGGQATARQHERAAAPRAPLELPRLVMRAALLVVLLSLLLALLLGLWRARDDMRDELAGALSLARIAAVLVDAPQRDDAQLVAELQAVDRGVLRHLHLRLTDAAGRVRVEPPPEPAPPWPVRALAALNRVLFAPPQSQTVTAALARPQGPPWQLQWIASHESEQREALVNLAEALALLAGCAALMLVAMRWRLLLAFKPLAPLLAAIALVERRDVSALHALPPMPVGELESIASALRHLAQALEQAEAQRRLLGAQVQTLQEDERTRLARELHDEFGQRLTALRVDTAWLARRLADQPELAAVVAGMGEQCASIQHEVRALLTRLRPLEAAVVGAGRALDDQSDHTASAERLQGLLAGLVAGWAQSPGQTTRYALEFALAGRASADTALPRELVLAVYRISQEALTNVARHAHAATALLRVTIDVPLGSADGSLHWSVQDDGRGLDHPGAFQRGNGLAGIKERIWAAGGDLEWQPLDAATPSGPGLQLHASLPFALHAEAA